MCGMVPHPHTGLLCCTVETAAQQLQHLKAYIIQGCLETVHVFTQQLNVGGAKDWYCQPQLTVLYTRPLPGCYSGHFISVALNVHTWVRLLRNKHIPVKLTAKHWLPGLYHYNNSTPHCFSVHFPGTKQIKTLQITIYKSNKKTFVTFCSPCAMYWYAETT